MIEFEHVSKTYETHNDENVALDDINIQIEDGEFVFILGHSGAGKSTFLKLIQMEEKPTEGRVIINGQGPYQDEAPQGAVSAPPDGCRLSGFPPDPHHDSVRECGFRHARDQHSYQKRSNPASHMFCPWSVWRIRWTACRTNFPAANNSVWR